MRDDEEDVEKFARAARNAAREMLGSQMFGRYSTLVETKRGYFNVLVEVNAAKEPLIDVGLRRFLREWGDVEVTLPSSSANGGTRVYKLGALFAGTQKNSTIGECHDEWEKMKKRLRDGDSNG